MKSDASNSVTGSATMSPTAPPNPDHSPAEGKVPLSEAEYLRREALRARAAISGALNDLGKNLKATGDPRHLTRDHPWIAVSTAAVAGFAAALALIPSKEQQALAALARLEEARRPTPPPSKEGTSDKAVVEGGVFATIALEALKVVRPLITTLLTAGISRATGGVNGGATGGATGESNGAANPNAGSGNGDVDARWASTDDEISSPS